MGYGDHKVRMSASKQAKSFCDPSMATCPPGQPMFSRKGTEFERLRALMEAHGPNLQALTCAGILDEDPFFAQFKPSSICQNISFIKKEHAQRDHVEGISKCKLTTKFYLTLL
jgi:hypothetical protein